MRFLDLPPIWLFAVLVLVWLSPWTIAGGWPFWLGLTLLAAAALLTLGAVREFSRSRTTIIPHLDPKALITGGIFRYTRNPIYLADLLILLGLSLIWGKPLGLLLAPPFAWLLQKRFILGEEARLRAAFGDAFERYAAGTRRWL